MIVIVALVSGVALVIFILALNLTVAVGTLNSIIFMPTLFMFIEMYILMDLLFLL